MFATPEPEHELVCLFDGRGHWLVYNVGDQFVSEDDGFPSMDSTCNYRLVLGPDPVAQHRDLLLVAGKSSLELSIREAL